MALFTPGYWQADYWPDIYWSDVYWSGGVGMIIIPSRRRVFTLISARRVFIKPTSRKEFEV